MLEGLFFIRNVLWVTARNFFLIPACSMALDSFFYSAMVTAEPDDPYGPGPGIEDLLWNHTAGNAPGTV